MLSQRHLPLIQPLLLSGLMSFIMSGAISFINLGWVEHFMAIWLHAWLVAWAIAYPTILAVLPFAKKASSAICSKP